MMLVAISILAISPVSVNAAETYAATNIQQQVRTVNAIYVSQGGISSILIQISGNQIVAYCSGRDYQGRQIWDNIQPVTISRNPKRAVSSSMEVNRAIMNCDYTARIGQLTIYF